MQKDNTKETKGWSTERRAAQAERCRTNRPWEHSTGPKTQAGKEAASRNALKHGTRSGVYNALRRALKLNGIRLKADSKLIYYAGIGIAHTNKLKEVSIKSRGIPPTPSKNDERSEGF